jgi:hypothetical protein
MKDIRDLLKEADPLLNESEPSAADRSARRQAVVRAAATAASPKVQCWWRNPIYSTVILIAIVAFTASSRLWWPFINNAQAAVRFEVRLAEQNPGPDLKEAKVAGTNSSIYLHNEVVVTNADIARAEVIPHESQSWIGVTLTPAGAQKMHSVTEKNIGKRMAILIDGEVISAPVVMDAIAETAVINGNITKEEAEKIVAGIMIH